MTPVIFFHTRRYHAAFQRVTLTARPAPSSTSCLVPDWYPSPTSSLPPASHLQPPASSLRLSFSSPMHLRLTGPARLPPKAETVPPPHHHPPPVSHHPPKRFYPHRHRPSPTTPTLSLTKGAAATAGLI
jgi:hypothetical protein